MTDNSPSPESSIFFAYAGYPRLRAETVEHAAAALNERGTLSKTWVDLDVAGRVLVNTICQEIDNSSAVVAEISDLNSNVLFEAGYALGRNKKLLLAFDESDMEAQKRWKEIGIFATVGRVNYSGNSERLVSSILGEVGQVSDLLETLMSGGRPRQPNAVFAPSPPTKFQASSTLESFLDRQSHLTILGGGDDLGLAPLDFYVKEIYRSSATIFHLLAPKRVAATIHNARASFLAGLAHGFDLPILMVVEEEGFESPLDYKDLLFRYNSLTALRDKVKDWLEKLPKQAGTNKRLGRLSLDIELPIRNFGQYVAEYEKDELTSYFIETAEFQSIMQGGAKVFVGRKGTGKTATMSQSVLELRKDRRVLVVPVKPSGYEMSGLLSFASRLENDGHSEYAMLSLWTYLLHTEIAVRTVIHASEKPAGAGTNDALRQLVTELNDLGVEIEDDLSVRLESAVQSLKRGDRRPGETPPTYIGRVLGIHRLANLRHLILATLTDFDRVAVLIDNLDKTWEKGNDYRLMSKFILALLSAIGKVEKEFSRPSKPHDGIKVTLTAFLRTDIYDILARFAREPDKVGELSVNWADPELLARVLEERYAANRTPTPGVSDFDMWEEVFAPEVRGIPTRDYLLWRVLPRPRDLIYFANASVTTAINRRHSVITEPDIAMAEDQYSRFAIEALLVESEAEGFDLEEALYEFAGVDSTMTASQLTELLSGHKNADEITDWLIRTSFLGVEVRSGEFLHVEGERAARRKLKVAQRFSSKSNSEVRFRVHPAFRAYLEVRDDDLHNNDIRDANYEPPTLSQLNG